METITWAIGILVTVQLAVTGFLAHVVWNHVSECKHVNARLASAESDLERMKEDIGTHDRGLRGASHKSSSLLTEHEMRLAVLERRK